MTLHDPVLSWNGVVCTLETTVTCTVATTSTKPITPRVLLRAENPCEQTSSHRSGMDLVGKASVCFNQAALHRIYVSQGRFAPLVARALQTDWDTGAKGRQGAVNEGVTLIWMLLSRIRDASSLCAVWGWVSSYKLWYIVGFWLVEIVISTNQKPTIYRSLYENTV